MIVNFDETSLALNQSTNTTYDVKGTKSVCSHNASCIYHWVLVTSDKSAQLGQPRQLHYECGVFICWPLVPFPGDLAGDNAQSACEQPGLDAGVLLKTPLVSASPCILHTTTESRAAVAFKEPLVH